MTLEVGTTPHSQWQVLAPVLAALGWENAQDADPEAWYQAEKAAFDPHTKHLLLHTRPEVSVARAIDAGQSPADALEAWRHSAEQLIAFYKRHRANTVVVEVCDAVDDPQALVSAVEQYLQLTATGDIASLESLPEPTAVNQLIANQLVAQNTPVTSLCAELEACTLPLSDKAFHAPALCLMDLYKQLQVSSQEEQDTRDQLQQAHEELQEQLESERRAHAQTRKALEESKEEGELVLKQLFHVQEELEARYLTGNQKTREQLEAKQQVSSEAERLQAALNSEKRSHSETQNALQTLQAESDKLRNELSLAQKQLKNQKSERDAPVSKQQAIENGRVQERLASEQREHERTKNILEETKEENDLILHQLFKVQEELERYYLENMRITNELTKLKPRLRTYEAQIKENDKNLHTYRKDNQQLNLQLKRHKLVASRLEQRLAQIQNSIFWKAAAPLRRAARLFSRTNARINKQAKLIRKSPYFDAEWYVKQYPDVAKNNADPAKHYLRFGATEERNPSKRFSTKAYLEAYSDVAQAGMNPLVHFVMHGEAEGRSPKP